jgi:transposase-like protein
MARCPECQSSDVSPISGFEKGCLLCILGVVFALIFARKTLFNKYECKDCGHKFS